MSYTVLARKYRPQKFSDLVGQEHVARTLGNALESGRVAHAFLFTGVRGIGKTTTARLLAKALNCETGPAREPCNHCDPCKEITAGADMDVLEIDGASNNGVDDVRRLQESLPYRPARDRFKVVIVDEVHMLSSGAFNAFLKTLEEPPAHVKFIFATTESHKIPLTIRSRCQRYDFRLIARSEIVNRVKEILVAEAIEADEAAISLVARQANGSMRDALTILDQIAALGGEKIRGEEVAGWLGLADRAAIFEVAKALVEGNAALCLQLVSRIAEQGLDVLHFSRELVELMRDMVVVRITGLTSELLELGQEEREQVNAITKAHSAQHLERAFSGVSRLVDEVARSSTPRITLEMGLVRLADRPALEPISELIAKLEALEGRMGSAGSAGGAPTPGARSDTDPRASSRGGRAGAAPSGSSLPVPQPSNRTAENAPERPAPRASKPPSAPRADELAEEQRAASGDEMGGDANGAASSETWGKIVASLRDGQPALGAIIEHAVPIEVSSKKLVLAFREGSFFGRQAGEPGAQEMIGAAAQSVFGTRPALQIVFSAEPEKMGQSVSQTENAREQERLKMVREKALNHPRVKDALEVFPEAKNHVAVRVGPVHEGK